MPAKEDNIYRAVKIFATGFALHLCHFYFFYFFFLFFKKVRNEDYLHGSNKHLDLHCAKICITSKRILRKQAGFNGKHSTTLISFA